ncbi:MAG TPA: efflux RND transporter periplasmic adaptor subunit [Methylomusa anaerophila]|uniref:Macrolide export protein MacA n=1 Tax=Methylomusa anaerophila TaxID=1930071 RepID=A0A348AM87_9FIRM|nr:efflux RND transporter periplasmic adaptor subunit [Methylomusa anaerophila]BBB92185.1 macrolide export protein MacA [Methylomusa anaerophila]HML87801.1 efflux RND transporter periplasmic adaptor subunit [Methylomusa anaerophila]
MQAIGKRIRQYKGWLILLLVVALLATGGAIYFKKGSTPVVNETTVTVGRGDIAETASATGTISAVNSVDISSRVTGLIRELNVKENDIVKAGQVLVVLDDTSLRAQLAQYEAQLENYAAIYERSQKMAAIGGESLQQLDTDRTNYLVSQSTYNNYASQLEYYVIKAPIDGVVVGKPTPAGQTVAQGISSPQVIMTIADMSQMQIKVMVDETDVGKVQVGQKVSFTVDAYTDKTFTGTVTNISKSATTSSNVVYYPVYVDVDSPAGLLYPTMTARVTVNIGESKNALVVPLSALKEDKGEQYVQLKENGELRRTPVQIGLRDDTKVEILSGLSEGDNVVIPAAAAKSATTTNTRQRQGPSLF